MISCIVFPQYLETESEKAHKVMVWNQYQFEMSNTAF